MTKPTFTANFPISFAAIAAANPTTNSYAVRRASRIEATFQKVREAIAAGEIIVSHNKDLRTEINHFVEAATSLIRAKYNFQSLPTVIGDLFWDLPNEARLIPGFAKKIDKAEKNHGVHPLITECRALVAELTELADIVAYLKSIEVKANVKRETEKAKKEEEARCRNLTDKVYQAVLPLKQRAIEKAEADTREYLAKAVSKLEKAGFDLNALAPYGDRKADDERTFDKKNARRAFYNSFTKGERKGFGAAITYTVEADRIEKLVEDAKKDAAHQFEAYVAKLNHKINDEVLEAVLETRSGLWFESTLTVTTRNKGVQKWFTQIIVNFSKYDRAFNQFPTRLVK
jgi:hypothetical protein